MIKRDYEVALLLSKIKTKEGLVLWLSNIATSRQISELSGIVQVKAQQVERLYLKQNKLD